jgi:hypothetical protein
LLASEGVTKALLVNRVDLQGNFLNGEAFSNDREIPLNLVQRNDLLELSKSKHLEWEASTAGFAFIHRCCWLAVGDCSKSPIRAYLVLELKSNMATNFIMPTNIFPYIIRTITADQYL